MLLTPENFNWPLAYDAEAVVARHLKAFLARNSFASRLAARMQATIQRAKAIPALAAHAKDLTNAVQRVAAVTQAAWGSGKATEALANAVPYMQAFGHTVVAWIWLDVSLAALGLNATKSGAASAGCTGATAYFYHYELPKIEAWLAAVERRDMTCADFPPAAF